MNTNTTQLYNKADTLFLSEDLENALDLYCRGHKLMMAPEDMLRIVRSMNKIMKENIK